MARARPAFRRLLGLLGVFYAAVCAGIGGIILLVPRHWIPSSYVECIAPPRAPSQVFFSALGIFTGAFLTYTGHARSRMNHLLITLILNVGLNLLLIPLFGALGAGLAASMSFLPYFLANWWRCEQVLGSNPNPARP